MQYLINNGYKWNSLLKEISGIIEILRTYLIIVINKKNINRDWKSKSKDESLTIIFN
jgi:hypothetical protein